MASVEVHTGMIAYDHHDLNVEYLRELRRFIRLKKEHEPELSKSGHKLMQRMISRRHVDCIRAGVKEQASSILRESFPETYSQTPEPAHPQAPTFAEVVSNSLLQIK